MGGGSLVVAAGGHTDWFVDPGSGATVLNAPALLGAAPGEYTLSCRVEAELRATFDAGALVLWADEHTWAKLALERSPQGEAMVVSVVTRGESDDCNSVIVGAESTWLRVASLGPAYAFHFSLDGRRWQFVRHFRFPERTAPRIGFEAQSPTGEGCRARFSEIVYRPGPLTDLRDGS
jgi:regulation of enolase protein 1 (concanavalin A-like superfamily)